MFVEKSMSYYRHHWFFCTNVRAEASGRPSCGRCDSARLQDYAKSRIKAAGLAGPGGVRVNTTGCLDRCDLGPVSVIYPAAVWYTYRDKQDLDEIIERHIKGGEIVTRLRLKKV